MSSWITRRLEHWFGFFVLSTYVNVDVNRYLLTGYYKTYNGLINRNVVYLNHFESKRLNVTLSCNKD